MTPWWNAGSRGCDDVFDPEPASADERSWH